MSEDKTPNSSNVVVSAPENGKFLRIPFMPRLSKKATIVTICVAVLVVAAIVVAIVLIERARSPKLSLEDNAYNTAVAEGDYAKGQQLLDDAIKKSTSKQNTANLYLQKASIALNSKRLQDAMQFAKKADSISPSNTTAEMIAGVAKAQGNKVLAIQWLNTAIKRLDKGSQGYQSILEDDQEKIQELSQ
jgi:tetratricopeptide (TPR) repeat protein